MRVDLPAPFSPTRAWISPASTVRLTSSSALTPGNVLVIPRISRIAAIVPPGSALRARGAPQGARLRLIPGSLLHLVLGVVAARDQHLLPVRGVDADRL